jgi:beta-aspartyl-peptidase (threonine type)
MHWRLSLLAVGTILAAMISSTEDARAAGPDQVEFAIAIHGGAGSDPATWSDDERRLREATLRGALSVGRDLLAEGGTSLDAVERVIRILEDDPLFNAGRGAVLNADGDAELDASIMDGRTKACGAVAAVRTVKNPISLARLVMTQTEHVLFVGPGADRFAAEQKVDQVEPDYFRVSKRGRSTSHHPNSPQAPSELIGTVGCVALDKSGNLAAGTSTGGRSGKMVGRVGDSPIIGAGTYADNASCAVSCTGVGEEFIRFAVAYDIAAQMAYRGQSVEQAVRIQLIDKLRPGDGGIIAVDKNGEITMQFSTAGMPRAAADSTGRFDVRLGRD